MALTKIDDRGLKTPIDLLDDEKIRLGTGNDLELYHDGTVNKITLGAKELQILGGGSNNKKIFVANTANAAELHFDNSKKLETTSTGATISGGLICQDTGEYQVILKDSNNTGNAAEAAIGFKGSDNATLGFVGFNYWGDGNLDIYNNLSGGVIAFETHNGTAVGERMRIDSSGNIGINTTDIDAKLHVQSATANDSHTSILATGNANDRWTFGAGTGPADASADGNKCIRAGLYFDTGFVAGTTFTRGGSATAGYMSFDTDQTERMRIDSSGRLLIGTTATSPSGAYNNNLIVYEDGDTGISIRGKDNNSNWATLSLGDTTAASRGYLEAQLGTNGAFTIGKIGTGNMRFLNNGAERATINSSGDLALKTGNLVIGTAGKGIDFSATSDATGKTSELLDDYEEGTFTPTLTYLTSDDGNKSYTVQHGVYTKIGRSVTVHFHLEFSNKGTGSGAIGVSLPFAVPNLLTSTSLEAGGVISYFSGLSTSWSDIKLTAIDGQSRVEMWGVANTHAASVTHFGYSHIGNAWSIRGTITYFI